MEHIFPASPAGQSMRWSKFKNNDPRDIYDVMSQRVFPAIKNMKQGRLPDFDERGELVEIPDEDGTGTQSNTAFARYMEDAMFLIPTPQVLQKIITGLEDLYEHDIADLDMQGICTSICWARLATAGQNGQFRTPKHIREMMVELMQQPQMDPQQRSEFLRVISNQLSRMQWLIQSLLKMARLQAGAVQFSPSPQKVRSLLSKALSQAEAELVRSGVEWIMECPDDFELMLDENWTVEALGNILRNCAEHTGRGGRIVIRCRRTMLADQIEIEDNGEGIDPQDLPHLFERFYRGRNARPDSWASVWRYPIRSSPVRAACCGWSVSWGRAAVFSCVFPGQIV